MIVKVRLKFAAIVPRAPAFTRRNEGSPWTLVILLRTAGRASPLTPIEFVCLCECVYEFRPNYSPYEGSAQTTTTCQSLSGFTKLNIDAGAGVSCGKHLRNCWNDFVFHRRISFALRLTNLTVINSKYSVVSVIFVFIYFLQIQKYDFVYFSVK